jgi:transcriptional regulator with XRE-family HTH domain
LEELALRAGMAHSQVSRYEGRGVQGLRTLERLLKVLDVKPVFFFATVRMIGQVSERLGTCEAGETESVELLLLGELARVWRKVWIELGELQRVVDELRVERALAGAEGLRAARRGRAMP